MLNAKPEGNLNYLELSQNNFTNISELSGGLIINKNNTDLNNKNNSYISTDLVEEEESNQLILIVFLCFLGSLIFGAFVYYYKIAKKRKISNLINRAHKYLDKSNSILVKIHNNSNNNNNNISGNILKNNASSINKCESTKIINYNFKHNNNSLLNNTNNQFKNKLNTGLEAKCKLRKLKEENFKLNKQSNNNNTSNHSNNLNSEIIIVKSKTISNKISQVQLKEKTLKNLLKPTFFCRHQTLTENFCDFKMNRSNKSIQKDNYRSNESIDKDQSKNILGNKSPGTIVDKKRHSLKFKREEDPYKKNIAKFFSELETTTEVVKISDSGKDNKQLNTAKHNKKNDLFRIIDLRKTSQININKNVKQKFASRKYCNNLTANIASQHATERINENSFPTNITNFTNLDNINSKNIFRNEEKDEEEEIKVLNRILNTNLNAIHAANGLDEEKEMDLSIIKKQKYEFIDYDLSKILKAKNKKNNAKFSTVDINLIKKNFEYEDKKSELCYTDKDNEIQAYVEDNNYKHNALLDVDKTNDEKSLSEFEEKILDISSSFQQSGRKIDQLGQLRGEYNAPSYRTGEAKAFQNVEEEKQIGDFNTNNTKVEPEK